MGKRLGIFGIVLTIVYLVAWGALVYHRSDTFKGMTLNEIGDFLGGSFGPLAFFWLVLGFFQQGIELRQNSEALRLQVKELENSVQQQKELVAVNHLQAKAAMDAMQVEKERLDREREQLAKAEAERLAARMPKFAVDGYVETVRNSYRHAQVNVRNIGGQCTNLVQRTLTGNSVLTSVLRHDEKCSFSIATLGEGVIVPDEFALQYRDQDGGVGIRFFKIHWGEGYRTLRSIQPISAPETPVDQWVPVHPLHF
ncbi:MAG TPA: hypothetical protein VD932_05460 [Aquabacterium sp.]|nr:hypothetical protein [Aquabacterium sp.]